MSRRISRMRVGTRSVDDGTPSESIRRAQLSFGAMWASESAFVVGLAVLAFRDGGVGAVGIVTGARMAAAALLAPFLATVADRVRRERVLTGVGLVRAASLGTAAVVAAAGGPTAVTYGLAVVATVALALFRPAHSALLPVLCSSPQQLTRANAVRGMLDSSATLCGPAAAAVLLAVSGPAAVFAACAAASLLGGLAVAGLPTTPRRGRLRQTRAGHEMLQGFATIAAHRGLALITALGVVQTFVRGCLTVFVVVVAIDLLGDGRSRRRRAHGGDRSRWDPRVVLRLRAGRARPARCLVRARRRAVRGAAGGDRRRPEQAATICCSPSSGSATR